MDQTENLTITLTPEKGIEFVNDCSSVGFETHDRYASFILNLAHAAVEAFKDGKSVYVPQADGSYKPFTIPRDVVSPLRLNRIVEGVLTDEYGKDTRPDKLTEILIKLPVGLDNNLTHT